MENGKYAWEWYNDPSRRAPGSNPFPEGVHLRGNHDTRQGEIGKKNIIFKQMFSKSRKDSLRHVQMLELLE
jgi:hypothetical protein